MNSEQLTTREQHISDLAYRIGQLEYHVPELLRLIRSRDDWDSYDQTIISSAEKVMEQSR